MRRLGLLLALIAGQALAAAGPASDAGVLARLPFGARSLAMGGDHGTLPRDPLSSVANPASLSALDAPAVAAGLHQGPDGVSWGGVAGGAPLLPWLAAGGIVETLGSGEVVAYDYTGVRKAAPLESDRLVGAAVAAWFGPMAAGLGARYFGSTVLDRQAGAAVFLDAGVTARWESLQPPGVPLRGPNPDWVALSLAVTGFGTSVDYGGASDLAPLTWRAGAAAGRDLGGGWQGIAAAALEVPRATARPEVHGGLEVAVPAGPVEAAVRAGARYRRDGGVLSVGAGASFRGVALDYALLSADNPFGPTHHVTLGFNWGRYGRAAVPESGAGEP